MPADITYLSSSGARPLNDFLADRKQYVGGGVLLPHLSYHVRGNSWADGGGERFADDSSVFPIMGFA